MKNRAYWICQVCGWGAYSAVGLWFAVRAVGPQPGVIAGYILFFCYSIALTHLLRREIRRRQWLGTSTRHAFLRLVPAALLVGTVDSALVVAFSHLLPGNAATHFTKPMDMIGLWMALCGVAIVWTLLYVAVTAARHYRESRLHGLQLQLALREAELRVLEAQINPHFLFNCLNSIRALVIENPPLAQDMLTRLANILRYNLHRGATHTVPLASEVEVVADYLALESVRFEERLRVQVAIDPGAGGVPIPAMLLQTLVENALKHGIASLPAGGDLRIHAAAEPDAVVVEVENSGQLAEPKAGATQVGLANVRERLRILYGERASLHLANRNGGTVVATVRIPRSA
ncbi:MAG: histidine kinase [Acidobacteriia bacterium]|nr:histidine kinase [Terriglobia bacterium]